MIGNWYKYAQRLENVKKMDLDDREITRAIRDAIMAEQDAVKQYETVVDSTGNEQVKSVLQDIANEERVHVGELMRLLVLISDEDEEKFFEKGQKEVENIGPKKDEEI